jgi:hypothetical protein
VKDRNEPAVLHPFAHSTVPRRVLAGLRRRELDHDEFVILAWLYGRADRRPWVASVRLAQLAEGIAWKHSDDYLSKRLRRLRRKGWLTYSARPGEKGHGYAIRLLYDGPEASADQSEDSPSTEAAQEAGSRVADARTGPRKPRSGPSTRQSANPLPERTSGSDDGGAVRASRDVREEAKTCTEKRFWEKRLGSSPGEDVREERRGTNDDRLIALALGRQPEANEAAFMSDLDELLRDGILIDPTKRRQPLTTLHDASACPTEEGEVSASSPREEVGDGAASSVRDASGAGDIDLDEVERLAELSRQYQRDAADTAGAGQA